MEFQPIVLAAGTGSRMNDLTAQCPKALLPIGNLPMVYYPIHMLERHGFQEVIVVVLNIFEEEIRKALQRCNLTIKLEFVTIPDTEDIGTAQTLNHIRDKITSDILVVGCDLITDLNLNEIANVFRKYDASVTVLLSKLSENRDLPTPGLKMKAEPEKICFGLDEAGERLLMMKTMVDMDEDEVFSAMQFRKYSCMRVRTTLADCHLYLMKKWIVDYLANHKDCQQMTSLKGELLPRIVKKQFPSPKRLKKSREVWKGVQAEGETDIAAHKPILSPSELPDIYAYSEWASEQKRNFVNTKLAQTWSAWNDHIGDMDDAFQNDVIRCYVYTQDSGFCIRSNTLSAYCDANRQISKVLEILVPNLKGKGLVHPSITTKDKSQVGTDCIIAEGVSIGEKVSVKKSVIGKNCKIGDKVRIANSIIMDDVTIGESCNVMNTVISSGSQLGEKCELKDSVVAQSTSLAPMSKYTNEVITDIEQMMEV